MAAMGIFVPVYYNRTLHTVGTVLGFAAHRGSANRLLRGGIQRRGGGTRTATFVTPRLTSKMTRRW